MPSNCAAEHHHHCAAQRLYGWWWWRWTENIWVAKILGHVFDSTNAVAQLRSNRVRTQNLSLAAQGLVWRQRLLLRRHARVRRLEFPTTHRLPLVRRCRPVGLRSAHASPECRQCFDVISFSCGVAGATPHEPCCSARQRLGARPPACHASATLLKGFLQLVTLTNAGSAKHFTVRPLMSRSSIGQGSQ